MKDSQRIDPIVDDSVRAIKVILQPGERDDQDIAAARIASSILATWARLKQAERAREAIYFTMARELATNREQLEEYIKITLPDIPLAQALGAKQLSLVE